jgi:hypothetical protein
MRNFDNCRIQISIKGRFPALKSQSGNHADTRFVHLVQPHYFPRRINLNNFSDNDNNCDNIFVGTGEIGCSQDETVSSRAVFEFCE